MGAFEVAAIIIALTAGCSYLNHRLLKLQPGIGVMVVGLLVSLTLILLDRAGIPLVQGTEKIMSCIDFGDLLLDGMLGLLLFSAALQVDLRDLAHNKIRIGAFAVVSTLISTLAAGGLVYAAASLMKLPLGPVDCLLFGALISPTDTVATIAILRKANAPRGLEMDVTGESLFNDGIGILAFVVLFHVWQGRIVGYGELCTVIFVRVLGGILMGVVLGYAANYLLRSIDHPRVQVLITLALAAAGYVLMMDMEMSGPLAIITAGLLVGHRLRHGKMGARSRSQLELFWEIMDEILNAVLFVLMGLEVLILNRTIEDVPHWVLVLAAAAVPLVLAARWISVAAPMEILRRRHHFARNAPWIMTWAALRGGVCIALALSLPQDTQHHEFVGDVILMMTYVVVAFSILVQGLTLRPVVAYLLSPEEKVSKWPAEAEMKR